MPRPDQQRINEAVAYISKQNLAGFIDEWDLDRKEGETFSAYLHQRLWMHLRHFFVHAHPEGGTEEDYEAFISAVNAEILERIEQLTKPR